MEHIMQSPAELPGNKQTSSESTAAAAPSSSANPMRKIIFMVGVAIVVFLAVTSYSVRKSFQSSDQLTAIKDLYFPVLQKIEANIVRLDKMEELFMRSVMLGDHDPLDEAQDFYKKGEDVFIEMEQIYPERAKEIKALREEYRQYDAMALQTAEDFLKNKVANMPEQTKRMNKTLNALRDSIKK